MSEAERENKLRHNTLPAFFGTAASETEGSVQSEATEQRQRSLGSHNDGLGTSPGGVGPNPRHSYLTKLLEKRISYTEYVCGAYC
jgi:hypothetical protein